jgi:radical SAM protein with 4Fe4S-binding SPASM domain
MAQLMATLREVATLRVSTVAFGGGEPTMRNDLGELARAARDLGLVPVTTTNGARIDGPRVRSLREFAQINVSHDGVGGAYLQVRGHDGAALAERAIETLSHAGMAVGVNIVITADTLDQLQPTVHRALELGATEVQLLRYKPAGRAVGRYGSRALRPDQFAGLFATIQNLASLPGLSVRIDCALVPLLSIQLIEMPDGILALKRLGVFGCEAARYLVGVGIDGALVPCSCWERADSCAGDWSSNVALGQVRAFHRTPGKPCISCRLLAVCRGGCQVVSRLSEGGLKPDPECPVVRMHAEADLVALPR